MKKILMISFLACFWISGSSQTKFILAGKIEFERRVNQHRLFFSDEGDGSFSELIKKSVPQFKSDFFELVFNQDKSLYKPGRESDEPKKGFFSAPAADNVVYKDLKAETSISTKQVYESRFLLTDSLKHIQWKLQPETRTIAGFECRKAVGRICDSVVVVAFYTDEIIASSGPESFSGLPGMILGLAIPRLYTTWFATKLELINANDENKITAPTKGKKASQKEMLDKVNEAIKDWGEKYRDRSMWMSAL